MMRAPSCFASIGVISARAVPIPPGESRELLPCVVGKRRYDPLVMWWLRRPQGADAGLIDTHLSPTMPRADACEEVGGGTPQRAV